MSSFYYAWNETIAARQQALFILALGSLALVIGWEMIPFMISKEYVNRMRIFYIACIAILCNYLLFMGLSL